MKSSDPGFTAQLPLTSCVTLDNLLDLSPLKLTQTSLIELL